MGSRTQRQSSRLGGAAPRRASWILLTAQSTIFVLLLHYSRIIPLAGGDRYLSSTAVFLAEILKLTLSLTMALYEVSKTAPLSMPATALLWSLSRAIFSGDSWKLVIPASLYTLSNSLQYTALSNMSPVTFQATYQLEFFIIAVASLILLRKSISPRKWVALVIILLGIALVQIPSDGSDEISRQDGTIYLNSRRPLRGWKAAQNLGRNLKKRSATYEGIEEDLLAAFPRMSSTIGLITTVSACITSGLADVYFEKVAKDSTVPTSLWIRNVQLAIYSVFPAFFIGVIFLDGEKVATNGFFQGYDWTVLLVVLTQALGGVMATFCVSHAQATERGTSAAASIILSLIGSLWFFDFETTGNFLIGTAAIIAATYVYGGPNMGLAQDNPSAHPPPIRISDYEKSSLDDGASPVSPSSNDFSIKLPTTPLLSESGASSSRPTSPGQPRANASRSTSSGYFDRYVHDD